MQFKDYARLYDLMYKDKNYSAETLYLLSVIQGRALGNPKALLELGCGTGNYSRQFSNHGFQVIGIDLSQDMVDIASGSRIYNSEFIQGDIRSYDLKKKFTLIVSLFHVFSYLTSDQDVRDFFSAAHKHLEDGGLLAFDLWYGPGVMADPPGNREKEMQNELLLLKRHTTALHRKELNRVEVTFDFDVTDKENAQKQTFSELHNMRYFFDEEIVNLSAGKFTVEGKYGWMSQQKPDSNNWYALYILKKV